MTGAFLIGLAPIMLCTLNEPDANTRGAIYGGYLTPYESLRKPGDPIAVSTLTVSNLRAGSEVRLFLANGTENAGGVESLSGSTTVTFTYNVYTTPAQAFLVILLPGYHPIRIPFQLGKLALAYTAYQSVDPSYIA